ncbi:galectin-4-like isoform X2 [Narcine bancroftii]|uniref:galectin-4-like isoform X2 n=1 Tax=Narcine bancroftii TaxID=1343680 RepID=UPI0038311222
MDFATAPPPVFNPPIPYMGPIPGILQDGDMIQIKGRVLPQCNRFHVNLQCGTAAGHCDVAFHFNPRFECPGYVVCNSFENQRWCSEERKHEEPIHKGETFQILILVQNDVYKVAVNDKHFLDFRHRLSLSKVNTISIDGQVEVVCLRFIKNQFLPGAPPGILNNAAHMFPAPAANPAGCMFPQPTAANPAFAFGPGNPGAPMFGPTAPADLQVPFKARIPGGLFPSKVISLQVSVKPSADSFVINLKPANSSDIALHISARFRSEQAVVRNSFIQNSWNKEERSLAVNPFAPGQVFKVHQRAEQDLMEELGRSESIMGRNGPSAIWVRALYQG